MRSVLLACLIFAGVAAAVVVGLVPVRTQVSQPPSARVVVHHSTSAEGTVQTRTVIRLPAAVTVASEEASPRVQTETGKNGTVTITVVGAPKIDETDAKLDALVQAQLEVQKYLRGLNPSVRWLPPLEYVRDKLVKGPITTVDVLLKDRNYQQVFRDEEGNLRTPQRAELQIEITPAVRREMFELARQDLSTQRLWWLAPVLAGVVLLLLAASAYIHLDERSKGYYTGWLRIAAAGVLAALLGSGWWWFSQRAVE